MKILFLDDDEQRRKIFMDKTMRICTKHHIIQVRTVEEAIAQLDSNHRFSIVYLDHDLGGQQMVESGEDTGYKVAQHIAQLDFKKHPSIVILHTFNSQGAYNMRNVLKESGVPVVYKPFGSNNFYSEFAQLL